MGRIVLCADVDSAMKPELLGLPEVDFSQQAWLEVISDAETARKHVLQVEDIDEVWIASTETVAAVNLAAAMRKDNKDINITLILSELSGSALSCAQAAGINGLLTAQGFSERFFVEMHRRNCMAEVASGSLELRAGKGAALINQGAIKPVVREASQLETREETKEVTKEATREAAEEATGVMHSPDKQTIRSLEMGAVALQEKERSGMKKVNHASAAAGSAFILSVLSGSGGAGKSTVAIMCAYLAAQRGMRVLMIDCDLQFGDMHQLSGAMAPLTMDDALADTECVANMAAHATPGVPSLISAPNRLERFELLSEHLGNLLDLCAVSFDVIVVNTGASWAEYHAALLERSTCALFLVDQRASSIRACQHALELCARLGIATGPFVFALNRCQRGSLFTSIDIACVMQGAHVFEIKDGGHEVEELLGAGMAAELTASNNEACQSVATMLDELLPSSAEATVSANYMRKKKEASTGIRSRRHRSSRRGGKRKGARQADEAFAAALAGVPIQAALR